jgi:hypothetical protein
MRSCSNISATLEAEGLALALLGPWKCMASRWPAKELPFGKCFHRFGQKVWSESAQAKRPLLLTESGSHFDKKGRGRLCHFGLVRKKLHNP